MERKDETMEMEFTSMFGIVLLYSGVPALITAVILMAIELKKHMNYVGRQFESIDEAINQGLDGRDNHLDMIMNIESILRKLIADVGQLGQVARAVPEIILEANALDDRVRALDKNVAEQLKQIREEHNDLAIRHI